MEMLLNVVHSNFVPFAAAFVMGVLWVIIVTPLKIYEWWHTRQLIKHGPPAPAGEWLGGGDDEDDDYPSSQYLWESRKRKHRFPNKPIKRKIKEVKRCN